MTSPSSPPSFEIGNERNNFDSGSNEGGENNIGRDVDPSTNDIDQNSFSLPFSPRDPYTGSDGWTGEKLRHASYKDLGSPSEVEDRFYHSCLNSSNTRSALEQFLVQPSSPTTRDYSIQIRAYDFLHQNPVLGDLLLRYPGA